MSTNFRVKIGLLTFICHLGILKRVEYGNSDFKGFSDDDLATLCKNLANFGLVTPISSLVTFAWWRHC